jgi:hypothetical protein
MYFVDKHRDIACDQVSRRHDLADVAHMLDCVRWQDDAAKLVKQDVLASENSID